MANRFDLYKDKTTGAIVEVFNPGNEENLELSANGNKMRALRENTTDAATEKHVPMIEKTDGGYRVFVGEVEHPMADDHYIEWIELITDKEIFVKFLQPGEKPEAIFNTDAAKVTARAYCNLHGNWKNEL